MLSDKELKKKFKAMAALEPDKYYATSVLKAEGFVRKKCPKCGLYYWTVHKGQDACGDAACRGRVDIFDKPPVKRKIDFVGVWLGFKGFFEKRGYHAVTRYPVIARWNPTTYFTNASIAAFQPYVISGECDPPARKLVIPQFCLRFGDIDNVGVTGSHCTGFVMIGQHMFVEPKEWSQEQAFKDIYEYITKEVGVPKEELTLHEDSWAGGGNFGPCMEFFSRGVELFNQVYMMFEHSDHGDKELRIKVLDMGLGMERVAWFSQGAPTVYDAAFPTVIDKLKDKLGVEFDHALYKKFAPLATKLNFDEVEDVDAVWSEIASEVKVPVEELKAKIQPMTALYSVAEHARALLFSISDGGLPSNVGGYYNLRVIFRRAMDFIESYGWKIDLVDVCEWHADYLEPIYPDLKNNLSDVKKVLENEKQKYYQTKKKGAQVVDQLLKSGKEVTTKKLIELYDSQGVSPETVKEEAKKLGMRVEIPDNFFALVAERHEKGEQKTQTRKEKELDLKGIPATKALYFDAYDYLDFEAQVLKIIDDKLVVLDRTVFYPTSGGQLHDKGKISGDEVVEIFKQGAVIIHVMKDKPKFKAGDKVQGRVDSSIRLQLTQHHTAAHIINGVARQVLGNHIWQAGASKSLEKARLDITHYDALSDAEMRKIEDLANKVIEMNLPIYKSFMPRSIAEAKYGFVLYQGGAVPGKEIRVVSIEGLDVEACGGTHLNLTGETKIIKLLKSTKIQDGIVRIEFTAGEAAEKTLSKEKDILKEASTALGVDERRLPSRVEELFLKWKKARKLGKGGATPEQLKELKLVSDEEYKGTDVLVKLADILQTQPEHVLKTILRFKKELDVLRGKASDTKNSESSLDAKKTEKSR
ncbi:alanine--tRNA ligase [Candidatus Woesearchaeota archaeon]|nr:alanine--tRNA ligase [Candidatus Woesearchaeota archaeon]